MQSQLLGGCGQKKFKDRLEYTDRHGFKSKPKSQKIIWYSDIKSKCSYEKLKGTQ